MIDPKPAARPSALRVLMTATVLAAGLAPLPAGWAGTTAAREPPVVPARPARISPGGYYESLIAGAGQDGRGAQGPLELCIMGNPIGHNRSQVKEVTRELKDDFLQFDLKPNFDAMFFGQHYTTNSQGMRDREYDLEKPAGVYRIVLLGSSIDMGWGVATPDTYENLLENWLNAEATRRGLSRRFEVLNFAVAAYGPVQRYDVFHRKRGGLPARPRPVLLDDARPPPGRDPPRRPDQEQCRPQVRLLPQGHGRARPGSTSIASRRRRGWADLDHRGRLQGQGQAELLDLRRRRPRQPRRRLPFARASPRLRPRPPSQSGRRQQHPSPRRRPPGRASSARHAIPLLDPLHDSSTRPRSRQGRDRPWRRPP